MTNGLSSPKATERPPGPMPQAARGAPPPSDAFAGMLDAHQARTAIAEGHSRSPETRLPERDHHTDCAKPAADEATTDAAEAGTQAPATDAAQPGGQTTPDAGTGKDEADDSVPAQPAAADAPSLAAALFAVLNAPVATDAAPAVAGAPVADASAPVAAPGTVKADVALQVAPAVPAATEAVVPAPAASVPAASLAVPAEEGAPLGAVVAPAPSTDGDAPATAGPTAKPPTPAPGAGKAGGDAEGKGAQGQAHSNAPAALEHARSVGASTRPAPQPAQAAAHDPVAAPAPTTPTAPAAGAAPAGTPRGVLSTATPVPLTRAAEAVENVLRLASTRGVTHARIALRPAELGTVDVHLRSTAEGIVARVVAHSPEAVQTLQQAASDLRRSLEEQGLNLLNLDIGQPGDRSAGRSNGNAGGLGRGHREASDDVAIGTGDETSTENITLRLPNGVLVDVLA